MSVEAPAIKGASCRACVASGKAVMPAINAMKFRLLSGSSIVCIDFLSQEAEIDRLGPAMRQSSPHERSDLAGVPTPVCHRIHAVTFYALRPTVFFVREPRKKYRRQVLQLELPSTEPISAAPYCSMG
jgi:hypothetical protein